MQLEGVKSRGALLLGISALAGVAIGWLLIPRAPSPDDPKAPAPEVRFLGRPLPADDLARPRALDWLRRYVAQPVTLALPDGVRRQVYLGRLGAQIDKARLAQLVRDAHDPTSPLRRAWRSSGDRRPLELPVPVTFETPIAMQALLELKDEFDRAPSDARMDLAKRTVVKETEGRWLDVDATLLKMERAIERGAVVLSVEFHARSPNRKSSELGKVDFSDVLGFFETPYNRGDRYQARTYNLRLAASKLDGRVLLPGEVFDFNESVGPRDEANGYKVAPVIAEGELVDGIGGGTCQISGTLHGAAFFAGLGVVERYPHTRPSAYIKMGLDATVVYPTINLKLENTYPFPVVLHQTVQNGTVRAEILGPKRTRAVTLIRRIDTAIPYEQVERPDPSLPSGQRALAQRGIAGFKVHRYRIIRDGNHAVRERWNDIYPPTAQIIRVGTGTNALAKAGSVKDDPAPEYLADELLVMTQGDAPAVDPGAAPASREQREPGVYGTAGWTAKAGMPFWNSTAEPTPKPRVSNR